MACLPASIFSLKSFRGQIQINCDVEDYWIQLYFREDDVARNDETPLDDMVSSDISSSKY